MFRNWHPKRMRLYHGSDQIVERPRILEPNRRMDFGKGFYTTQSYKQTERWVRVSAGREGRITPTSPSTNTTNPEDSRCSYSTDTSIFIAERTFFHLSGRNSALT